VDELVPGNAVLWKCTVFKLQGGNKAQFCVSSTSWTCLLPWLGRQRGAPACPSHPVGVRSQSLPSAPTARQRLRAVQDVFGGLARLGLLCSCNWAERLSRTGERDACAGELLSEPGACLYSLPHRGGL